MSHPAEGLFGESVDYSTAHISGKAKNGNIFNWEGETIQRQWDDEYIINTRTDEEGVVYNPYTLEISILKEILFTRAQP